MSTRKIGSKHGALAIVGALLFASVAACSSETPEPGGDEDVGTSQGAMMEHGDGCSVVVGCLWHDPQWPGGCRQMGLCMGHQVGGLGICTTGCN
jgi:hypothetical protein